LLLEHCASHKEVLNELLVAVLVVSSTNNQSIHRRVACLDECVDGLTNSKLVKLSFTKLAPDLWLVYLLCVFSCSLDVLEVKDEDTDSFNMLTKLLVDAEGFIVKLILFFLSNLRKLNAVIVIKSVDVVHDTGLVSLYSCEDKEVLEILVAGEVRVMKHDSFQKLNQLVGHISVHECFDSS